MDDGVCVLAIGPTLADHVVLATDFKQTRSLLAALEPSAEEKARFWKRPSVALSLRRLRRSIFGTTVTLRGSTMRCCWILGSSGSS